MYRHTLSTVAAVFLAAVVGAQGPKGPSAQQQGELYKKNRPVIEKIVVKTIESARTPDNHVTQANSYYEVLYKFSTEIDQARQANEPDRVADLARMYQQVVAELERADGLSPDEVRKSGQKLLDSLTRAVQETSRVLEEAPPDSKKPLQEIVTAAWNGRQKLATKVQG